MRKLTVFLFLLGSLTVFSSCSLLSLTKGLDEMMALEVGEISLSAVENGSYRGSFTFERWSNMLEVTVQGHAITAISIIKDVRFAKAEVSNAIFKKVLDQQSLEVDAVSGSTVTSKAYLKSIELALQP